MGQPRMLILAKPPAEVLSQLRAVIAALGIDEEAAYLSPWKNWHQSFSNPGPSHPQVKDILLQIGDAIHAADLCSFTLSFDQVHGPQPRNLGDPMHWEFFTSERPKAFDAVLDIVQQTRGDLGLPREAGHRPHITFSYWAPGPLPKRHFEPIDWLVDELLLVEGRETNGQFAHEVLHRWRLQPPRESPRQGRQQPLFD